MIVYVDRVSIRFRRWRYVEIFLCFGFGLNEHTEIQASDSATYFITTSNLFNLRLTHHTCVQFKSEYESFQTFCVSQELERERASSECSRDRDDGSLPIDGICTGWPSLEVQMWVRWVISRSLTSRMDRFWDVSILRIVSKESEAAWRKLLQFSSSFLHHAYGLLFVFGFAPDEQVSLLM